MIKLYKVEDGTGYSDRWFTAKKEAKEYLQSIRYRYDEASLFEIKLQFSTRSFVCSLLNRDAEHEALMEKTLIVHREFWKEPHYRDPKIMGTTPKI